MPSLVVILCSLQVLKPDWAQLGFAKFFSSISGPANRMNLFIKNRTFRPTPKCRNASVLVENPSHIRELIGVSLAFG